MIGSCSGVLSFQSGFHLSIPLLLREGSSGGTDSSTIITSDEQEKEDSERAICCRACSGLVTQERYKIQVEGKHQHTFFNPTGVVYEIGCFSDASGTVVTGEPSPEFAWFAGTVWRFVLCSSCLTHLGWFYEGSYGSFYGLILKRLAFP